MRTLLNLVCLGALLNPVIPVLAQTAWDMIDPVEYANSAVVQKQWATNFIDKIKFAQDDVVLDVGSGDGQVASEIAKKVPKGKVFGIDKTQGLVDMANSRFGSSNLTFHKADIRTFAGKQSYTRVVSCFCLSTFREQEQALRNIWDSLKPGCKAHILITSDQNTHIDSVFAKVLGTNPWGDLFKSPKDVFAGLWTVSDYKEALKRIGFKVNHVDTVTAEGSFADRKQFFDWLYVWRYAFKRGDRELSTAQYIAFDNAIIDAYLTKVATRPNGTIPFVLNTIEIEVTKP